MSFTLRLKLRRDPELLHTAAKSGDLKTLTKLLNKRIKYGIKVNQLDKQGFTAVYLAGSHGHFECMMALLEAGADPYLTQYNLLHLFIDAKRLSWVGYLFYFNTSQLLNYTKVKDAQGVTAIAKLEEMQRLDMDWAPLGEIIDYVRETRRYLGGLKGTAEVLKAISQNPEADNLQQYLYIDSCYIDIAKTFEHRIERLMETDRVEANYPEARALLVNYYHKKAIEYFIKCESLISCYRTDKSENYSLISSYENLYKLFLTESGIQKASEYALKAAHYYLDCIFLKKTYRFTNFPASTQTWLQNYLGLVEPCQTKQQALVVHGIVAEFYHRWAEIAPVEQQVGYLELAKQRYEQVLELRLEFKELEQAYSIRHKLQQLEEQIKSLRIGQLNNNTSPRFFTAPVANDPGNDHGSQVNSVAISCANTRL